MPDAFDVDPKLVQAGIEFKNEVEEAFENVFKVLIKASETAEKKGMLDFMIKALTMLMVKKFYQSFFVEGLQGYDGLIEKYEQHLATLEKGDASKPSVKAEDEFNQS